MWHVTSVSTSSSTRCPPSVAPRAGPLRTARQRPAGLTHVPPPAGASAQLEHSDVERLILVSHSHYYRAFFRRFLHPTFFQRDPVYARTLQTKSVPNCSVLACELDFSLRPYVVRNVNVITFPPAPSATASSAKAGSEGAAGQARRPASAYAGSGAASARSRADETSGRSSGGSSSARERLGGGGGGVMGFLHRFQSNKI